MINKEEIKKILIKEIKNNPNYLNEQVKAYDTEFALQKTFMIKFFSEDKLKDVKEVRDYLFELKQKGDLE